MAGLEMTRLMIALVVIVCLLCVEALVLALIVAARVAPSNLAYRSMTTQSSAAIHVAVLPPVVAKKIYLFSIGHDVSPHEFIDKEGRLAGFGMEIMDLVCTEAEIDCRPVWSRYTECWRFHRGQQPSGGEGIQGGWFDACLGWSPTIERIRVFRFSMPYLEQPVAYFFVQKGSSFNEYDIQGKVIGFINGWASDERCLARQSSIRGRVLDLAQIDYSIDIKEAIDKLGRKKIDAILASRQAMQSYVNTNNVDYKDSLPMMCSLAGTSIMTPKNSDLSNKWNVGFQKARTNGMFAELCSKAVIKYGHRGPLNCVPS